MYRFRIDRDTVKNVELEGFLLLFNWACCQFGAKCHVGIFLMLMVAGVGVLQAAPPTPGTVLDPVNKPVLELPPATLPDAVKKKTPAVKSTSTAKKINVEHFVFTGNSIFSDEELAGHVAKFEGTEISLAEIYRLADFVEELYRDRGYLLTSVYLPAQKISSGTVKFEIIEGILGAVHVQGNKSYTKKFIQEQLDEIEAGSVLSEALLEKETLLLNELPGLSAKAIISPGAEYGSSDITFNLEEDLTSGVVRLNNYGRKSIGEIRLEAGYIIANAATEGDQVNLSAIVTDGLLLYRVDYDALVSNSGMRIGGGISSFEYEVDTQAIGLTGVLEGEGTNIQLKLTQPLVRSRDEQLDVGVVIRHSETDETGNLADPLNADRSIDLLDLSIAWLVTHRDKARTNVSFVLSTNFVDYEMTTNEDGQKAKFTLNAGYVQPFAKSWFWSTKINAVHSSDRLADVERYRIGGPNSVRAFPSAELAGDRGSVISLDVGNSFAVGSGVIMTASMFADSGRVTQEVSAAGQPDSESISGVGIGLTTLFGKTQTLHLEIVKPNGDRISSDERDTRGWINYSVMY